MSEHTTIGAERQDAVTFGALCSEARQVANPWMEMLADEAERARNAERALRKVADAARHILRDRETESCRDLLLLRLEEALGPTPPLTPETRTANSHIQALLRTGQEMERWLEVADESLRAEGEDGTPVTFGKMVFCTEAAAALAAWREAAREVANG